MYLFNYAYRTSLISLQNQSVAVRAAFMLADEVVIGGDMYKGIMVDNLLKSYTAQRAAAFMKRFEVDPAGQKHWEQIIASMKDHRAIKHKSAAVITSMKKLDKSVMEAWEVFRKMFVDNFAKTGIAELEKMYERDGASFLGASSDPEKIAADCYPCSKVLMLESKEKDAPVEQSYFIMPEEYHRTQTGSAFNINNWNEINFTFCNINVLKWAELLAVREQLRPAAKPFCEAINKWSNMLPTLSPEQSFEWYQQHIKPEAATLQQAIDANPILNDVNRLTNDNIKVYIHIGEAPTQAMWQFYDAHQSIPEATKKILEKPEAINFGAKGKPYFTVSYLNLDGVYNQKPNADKEIAAVKKSIVFD